MPDQDPGEEGRRKRGKWARAAHRARAVGGYAATGIGFAKNLIDVFGFIVRHL